MKDGQWKDWTEPLEVLLAKAREFLKLLDPSDFPRGGKCVVAPELHTRKEELAKAFVAYMDSAISLHPKRDIDNLLANRSLLVNYVYLTSVYEDVYGLVFEYIGENEHQMDLHGDEFAQTKETLLEDFTLYVDTAFRSVCR